MAVAQDPAGASTSVWQPSGVNAGRVLGGPNSHEWAENSARGIEKAKPFYQKVFGWAGHDVGMGDDQPPYTEFHLAGERIAGGMEMNPMVPEQVPSYWMVYFAVDDVDKAFKKAIDTGGQGMPAPPGF